MENARRTRFIVLEGGEGAGKSTQAKRLAAALEAQGHSVVLTREPGGTEGGERIRNLLVAHDGPGWTPLAEVLLINAARSQHVDGVIQPALKGGKWVVCDRFADSTMAYQGYGRGVDQDFLRRLRTLVVGDAEPGLTVIFDLDVQQGLARSTRDQRYERMGLEFHQRLREAFREIAEDRSVDRCTIDASGDVEQVWRRLAGQVESHFGVKL